MKEHIHFNNYMFSLDKKTNFYLSTRKINGKRERLHRYVWIYHFGEIPKGYHIHHKDENRLNNDISNLELLQENEHLLLHGKTERCKDISRKNLKLAQKSAILWHKSEKGKEFHKKLSKMSWENKQPISYVCTQCGKSFESLKSYSDKSNRFCHNNCKARYRRERIKNQTCLQDTR